MGYEEIPHFSHPQHKLRFECTGVPFKCDGCKEVGIGSRYKCDFCNFDLHRHCALPLASFSHPFYPKCSFQFLSQPPGNSSRYCNACEKDVNGFVYHCSTCGFDLHPCCANLPRVVDDGHMKLFLYSKVGASCNKCARKGRSWSYRSTCKKYNLHVSCVMEMLVESWHELYVKNKTGGSRKFETQIPSIKATLPSPHGNGGNTKRRLEMARMALQFIISALLGDPTTIIAAVIGSLLSK